MILNKKKKKRKNITLHLDLLDSYASLPIPSPEDFEFHKQGALGSVALDEPPKTLPQ